MVFFSQGYVFDTSRAITVWEVFKEPLETVVLHGEAKFDMKNRADFSLNEGCFDNKHVILDGFEKIFPSIGAGMRFKVLKEDNINLRVDYAIGKVGSKFYITFGEAF